MDEKQESEKAEIIQVTSVEKTVAAPQERIRVLYEADAGWNPTTKVDEFTETWDEEKGWQRAAHEPKRPPLTGGKRYVFGIKDAEGNETFEPSGRVQA